MNGSEVKKRADRLTEGRILNGILWFAIPLFIGQIFQLLYGIVDVRVVGEILGENSLAAVGAISTLSDLLVGFLNGFTNGLAILIATFYGAKNEKHLKKALGGTITFGILAALLISFLGLAFLNQILGFLNVREDLMAEAREYSQVILAGLIFSALYNTCAAVLRALGDSFTPLIFLIFSSLCNVALDYLFIGGLGMGVSGAALATVISQVVSATLCIFYARKRYPILKIGKKDFWPDADLARRLLASAFSMAFMVSFVQFGTLALQTSINTFGSKIIVAHTAARKATGLFMLPFSALGTALATFCGQNLGAGKTERIREGIFKTVAITWVWCLGVMAVTYLWSGELIKVMIASSDIEIISVSCRYLRFDVLFYFVPAVISLFRNSMQGFGDTKTPVFSSMLELLGKVAVVLFLTPKMAYDGIIVAEPIVWVIMVIPLIINMFRNPAIRRRS